ncbi:Uncharacterised protein [Providencia rettgeri]|nr:Uncharacterised protein [Providencia rettgeri]
MTTHINLNQLFEEVDKQLIAAGVPISYRHMKALSEISKRFNGVVLPISPNSLLPNNKLGNQLCHYLHLWYNQKYGENQNQSCELGSFYMKIQGDLWKYKIPLFYGQCNFFICKDLTDKGMNNEANILCMSKKMTQAYVNNLSENDLSLIATSFLNAVNVFQTIDLWSSQNLKMLNAAIADLRNIYVQLDSDFPHYGQAKWSYLQCAEKIIKSWLLESGISETDLKKKYSHNIKKLSNAFNELYVQQISVKDILHIECTTDARYEDDNDIYGQDDSINAQNWLFELILSIGYLPQLKDNPLVKI